MSLNKGCECSHSAVGTGSTDDSKSTEKGLTYVPAFRGYIHLVLALISPIVIIWLTTCMIHPKFFHAYALAFCCCVMNFVASAVLHFEVLRGRICDIDVRLDYACIFIMIGGSALPAMTAMAVDDLGVLATLIQWIGIAIGIVASLAFKFVTISPAVRVVIYFTVASPYIHMCYTLYRIGCTPGLPSAAMTLIIYFTGGIIYAKKSPNPSPKYFGYHELFHLCCALALVTTFVGNHKITNCVCND